MNHGTRTAYRTCTAGTWGACDKCKAAQAAYQRDRRARAKARRWAEVRASRRLVAAFPDVWEALVAEEMEAVA